MYRILILLEEVDRTENLAEACQIFLQRFKKLIEEGGICLQNLLETCMIQTEIDGSVYIMNFPAIRNFSHEIGLLEENGTLNEIPLPFIPRDVAKGIFLAIHLQTIREILDEIKEEIEENSIVPFIVPLG